jgi:hypothetical protein
MKKLGFTLVQLLMVVAIMSIILVPVALLAADRGPQRATSTVTTNSAAVAIPIGDTGRFTPRWMTLSAPSGVTSAVYYVASGYTGTVNATAASGLLSLTNVPTMFYGDSFRVVPSSDTNGVQLATNSITIKVIGDVFD